MICRELHNERSRVAGEQFRLFQNNTGADNRRDTYKICARSHPGSSVEQRARDQGNDRQFRSAWHKSGRHDRHLAVTVIFNRPGCHNPRHPASGADQHRNEGFAGQSELPENTVHDERDTRHISASLQESQEQEQHEHLRNKSQDCSHAAYNAVQNQPLQPVCAVQAHQHALDGRRDNLPEQHVVGPVSNDGSNSGNGHVIYDKHNQRENRQCQDTVGHDPVDLIRYGHLAFSCFFITLSNDRCNKIVTLIGNDTFRIVVHLFFQPGDDIFHVRRRFQLVADLVVALKQFDGEETFLLFGHF